MALAISGPSRRFPCSWALITLRERARLDDDYSETWTTPRTSSQAARARDGLRLALHVLDAPQVLGAAHCLRATAAGVGVRVWRRALIEPIVGIHAPDVEHQDEKPCRDHHRQYRRVVALIHRSELDPNQREADDLKAKDAEGKGIDDSTAVVFHVLD